MKVRRDHKREDVDAPCLEVNETRLCEISLEEKLDAHDFLEFKAQSRTTKQYKTKKRTYVLDFFYFHSI